MPRAKKKIHYLYKTTCNVTNRYYIGMHSTTKMDDGYMGSGKRLRYSIRKHGEDNHTKEVLEFFESRELLIEAEIKAITPEMITDKDCMNLMEGGTGGHGFWSKEHEEAFIKAGAKAFSDKFKNDVEFREKRRILSSKNMTDNMKQGKIPIPTFKGKTHSDESKKKQSEANKGKGKGSTNSQFGKCWITNEKENKKIYKGDEIPEGWRLGRTMI